MRKNPLIPIALLAALVFGTPSLIACAEAPTASQTASAELTLAGMTFSAEESTLDLSGKKVSLSQLQAVLPSMTQLKTLDLSGTGIAEDDILNLRMAYPKTNIISTVTLAGETVTLDSSKALVCGQVCQKNSTKISLTGTEIDVAEVERKLDFFPKLEKITMLNADLDCAYMDEVDQRHPDVRFVWTVPCGGISVRSDTLYFYPGLYFGGGEAAHTRNLRYCRDLVAVDLGHFWTYDLDWVNYTPHLKFLILMNSRVSDLSPLANLKELYYLEIFETNMVLDYTPLLEVKSLRDINIGINEADPAVFGQMTWLNNLHWNDISLNDEQKKVYARLPEMLPDTRVATTGFGMLANGWRFLCSYYAFRDLISGVYLNQEEGYSYWGYDFMPISFTQQTGTACGKLAEIVARRIENGESIPGIKDSSSDRARELYDFMVEMQAIIDTRDE